MHFNYQIFYINLLYLLLALILGTNIIIYLLYHNYINGVNYNKRGYYINPKIISGIVTEVIHEDNKRPIITFEYTVNNIKYTNTSNEYNLIYTNYKKNDKIQIIYSSDNGPEYSSIYDETITYYSWIYIILLVIALILLWIFFIYDIYNKNDV
jgi:ATP-dependent Zn protease